MIKNFHGSGRAAFTLLEVTVVIALLGILLGAIANVYMSTLHVYSQGSSKALVQMEASRVLNRIAAELENGGLNTLQPNPVVTSTDSIVFQAATGVDANTGAITFGAPTRIYWTLAPGEANNGIDDDGDGLIDEGDLIMTRQYLLPGQKSVVLAHGVSKLLEGETANGVDDNGNGLVDEHGFCVFREGDLLRVRLTLERSVKGGKTVRATVETGIRLRN